MKICTDKEQSLRLAKILPPDYQDMVLMYIEEVNDYYPHILCYTDSRIVDEDTDILAYSLENLLDYIPAKIDDCPFDFYIVEREGKRYYRAGYFNDKECIGHSLDYEEAIDAIVDLIEYLKEQNKL